ncbi:MAG: tetratricopeptide repeat protein [Thiomargarita sp.]|nr:tetratricopeptide repeat protein [Thiomargarita sp.]
MSVTQKIKKLDSDIGSLNFYLADFYSSVGQLDSALRVIEVAKGHFKQWDAEENLAIFYSRLGSIHQALGQVDKALEFFELRMQLGKELYESNPKSESFKNGLAISYL